MKQQILCDICAKLDELQIPFSIKDDTSIYVNTDFYEIGTGAEFKKISYELTVFLDEAARSVSMYVKTVDQCLVTAGGETCAVPAPSTTMFRKVKRYCTDQEGRGSVVTTDLGEVPNTVKNTAFKYGWKFSTALNLNKFRKNVEPKAALEFPVETVTFSEPELPAAPVRRPRKTSGSGLKKLVNGIFRHKGQP
jgi:hypothetical protein